MWIVNGHPTHLLLPLAWVAMSCNSTPSASTPEPSTATVQVPAEAKRAARPEEPGPEVTPAPTGEPAAAAPGVSNHPEVPRFKLGCQPFDPIPSQDACNVANDCAPSSPCHATSCVAAAKAPSPSPNAQCTMKLVCKSIDVGRCDCVNGMCALVSR